MSLSNEFKPLLFSEILGQDETIKYLMAAIELYKPDPQVSFPNGLLISGPSGTGKTSLAILFIKAVKCLNREVGSVEPCNKCSSCERINRAIPLWNNDVSFYTAGPQGAALTEDILKICHSRPTEHNALEHQHRRRRFIIVDEAQCLEDRQISKLLAHISDAHAYHITWIFCTMQLELINPTLRNALESRCIPLKLNKIPDSATVDTLVKKYPGSSISACRLLAKIAKGNLRAVWSILTKIETVKLAENPDGNIFFTEEDICQIEKFPKEEERFVFLSALDNPAKQNSIWTRWQQTMTAEEIVSVLSEDLWTAYIANLDPNIRVLLQQLQLWARSDKITNPLFLFGIYGPSVKPNQFNGTDWFELFFGE